MNLTGRGRVAALSLLAVQALTAACGTANSRTSGPSTPVAVTSAEYAPVDTTLASTTAAPITSVVATTPAVRWADESPLAGKALYRKPNSAAEQQAEAWEKAGMSDDAALIRKIADQPTAQWFGGDANITAHVNDFVSAAAAVGQLPVLVAFNIPGRDCGSFSAGGAVTAADYLDWIDKFAAGLGQSPAVVILEPDAVDQAVDGCLSGAKFDERLQLLKSAVETLSADTKAKVYLDAGNPGWMHTDRLVSALRLAGGEEVWGLSVNVSNFYTTDDSVAYGMTLSAALNRRHIIVDTSRNGNGPYTGKEYSPTWCNPPGRALGQSPTTSTGTPLVDAYLWVKSPGESDGECGHGDPPAGEWWPAYALGLARGSS